MSKESAEQLLKLEINQIGKSFGFFSIMSAPWYFFKGAYHAPKSKFFNGIILMKKKAPVAAGKFVMWSLISSAVSYPLRYFWRQSDPLNILISNTIGIGVMSVRAGPRIVRRNMLMVGSIFGVLMIIKIHSLRSLVCRRSQQQQMEAMILRKELQKNPKFCDFFDPDGTPRLLRPDGKPLIKEKEEIVEII